MTHNVTRTYVPKKTNHTFHLLLTLFTCGMWAPVWACVAIYNMMAKDKHTTVGQPPNVWHGPTTYPYAVGPGAPVSPQNPAPPLPPMGTPSDGPLRPSGASVFLPNRELAFGPRCGQCEGCRTGSMFCVPRDGQPDLPPPSPPQPS